MKRLFLASALLLLAGCGTLEATFSRIEEKDPLVTYPSTWPALQFDTEVYGWLFNYDPSTHEGIDRAFHGDWFFWSATFLFTTVDYPISAVTDTLAWPYDRYRVKHTTTETKQ